MWCIVSNRVLVVLFLALLSALSASAQSIEARFSTEKTDYLVGEPIFVTLAVSNKTSEATWLDFKGTGFPFPCNDFDIEVPGAAFASDGGCGGEAASCGRGFREVQPLKTILIRRLVDASFRIRQPGLYEVRAHAIVSVHHQNLFDSPEAEKLDLSQSLAVRARGGTEQQLKEAFQPYVEALNSSDEMIRGDAAHAITELAPPFLEDVLIKLAKSHYAYGAIIALRKVNTSATRAALAEIATRGEDPSVRIEAIQNLGRTNDPAYLPRLFNLMESEDKQVQHVAAEAAGNVGGSAAVNRLSALVSNPDAETRSAGANGLGQTRAREAVPILIEVLLDSDANVRQTAVSSLSLLTHYAAFDGNAWADISTAESAAAVHQRWVKWWSSHWTSCEMHGSADCASPKPL